MAEASGYGSLPRRPTNGQASTSSFSYIKSEEFEKNLFSYKGKDSESSKHLGLTDEEDLKVKGEQLMPHRGSTTLGVSNANSGFYIPPPLPLLPQK